MKLRNFLLLLLFLAPIIGFSQELNCQVQVLSQQIQRSDKRIFETLQNSIFEFMNNTRWTNDVYKMEERIECTILINVTDQVSNDEFRGTLQIQSRRPVYKTSYNTVMFNYSDQDFQFKYLEFQPLEFALNTFTTNLTSMLAFYAYMVIGFDYDSFSPLGGTPHFQKAQTVVANAQNTPEKGWKAFDGNKNRYWMVENLMSQTFEPLRNCYYRYHRKGLDNMGQEMDDSREEIVNAILDMNSVHKIKPVSFNMQVFFTAKADEIVDIYSKAFPDLKSKIVQICSELDPGNNSKYQKILSSN
jgi:hypothetical protein